MKYWQGIINLFYEHEEDKTKVKSVFSQTPFKIQQSFYLEGKSICHSIILHTAGGIAGNDFLCQNIHLSPQSQVLITTPSATKIYRCPQKTAFQNITIQLDYNSYLEYLPQEAIAFNQANFEQKMRVNLAEKASYLGGEIIRFGGSARGEIFNQGKWLNYLEIYRQNKPIWLDRQYFVGESNLFSSLNGLRKKPVLGNLVYIISDKLDNDIASLRHLLKEKYGDKPCLGLTALPEGLLCRYLGDSVSQAKEYFIFIWQFLRAKRGFNPHFKPRIWQS